LKKMPVSTERALPDAPPKSSDLQQWWISAYYADGKNLGPATLGKVHAGNMFDIGFVTPALITLMPIPGTPLSDPAKETARKLEYAQGLVQRLTQDHVAFYGAVYVIGDPNGKSAIMSPWKFMLRTGTGARLEPTAVTFGDGGEDPVHINRPAIGPEYWMRTVLIEFDTTDPLSKKSLITDKLHSLTLETEGPGGSIRAKYLFDPSLPAHPESAANEASSASPASSIARAIPGQPQRFPFAADWLDNQTLLELRGGDDIGWDAGRVVVSTGAATAYSPLYTSAADAIKIVPTTDIWMSPDRKSLLLRDQPKWDLLDTAAGSVRSWPILGTNAAWMPDGAAWMEWTDPFTHADAGATAPASGDAKPITQIWVHTLSSPDEMPKPLTLADGGVVIGPVDSTHLLVIDKMVRHGEAPATVSLSSYALKTGDMTSAANGITFTGGLIRELWDAALSPTQDRIAWLVVEAHERKDAAAPAAGADGTAPAPEQRARYDADLVASVWLCDVHGGGLKSIGRLPLQEHNLGTYHVQPGALLAPGGLKWSPDGTGLIFRYGGAVYGVPVK
jgi:hypothetical protein